MEEPDEKLIDFEIDHIDTMGQGVHREDGVITFLPKTLPGEKGQAYITKRRKGVQFAKALNVSESSSDRVIPDCPHFHQCPACHFLHTSYERELEFKKQSLARLLKPLNVDEAAIQLIKADERLAYRNRIQLHYRDKVFGMIDANHNEVIEIPECKIIAPEVKASFDKLYRDKKIPPNQPERGHCELYSKEDGVHISWNNSYAEGGFTQVNQSMNEKLIECIVQLVESQKVSSILDLFSGYGNLSDGLLKDGISRMMVDMSPQPDHLKDYVQYNLFKEQSLSDFQKNFTEKVDLMLVDPPRKGFPLLKQWLDWSQPEHLIYVSCKAATMVRDLREITDQYSIESSTLIDLFPSSHHFETVVSLKRK